MLKKIILIAVSSLALVCTLGMTVAAAADGQFDGGAAVVNPLKEYETFDELQKAVDFTITPPKILPKGYKLTDYTTIAGDMAQISYKNEKDSHIIYRAMPSKKAQDISGDYNVYKKESTLTYGDCTVTIKGSRIAADLAIWYKDGISYSLTLDNGVTWSSMERILDAMLKPEK